MLTSLIILGLFIRMVSNFVVLGKLRKMCMKLLTNLFHLINDNNLRFNSIPITPFYSNGHDIYFFVRLSFIFQRVFDESSQSAR